MSRFRFLRVNRLFETTPLTGYAFIANAKTAVEVIFWYGVIITMTLMTIINIYGATMHYLSRPTKTYVEAASSTENTSIADLNFELNMSLIEFTRVNPTALSYKDQWVERMLVQHLACNAMLPTTRERIYYDLETHAIQHVMFEWAESLISSWDEFGTEILDSNTGITHLSDKRIFIKWFEELGQRGTELYNYLWENRWTENPADQYGDPPQKHSVIMEALELFNKPLQSRSKYTPYYLMLLKALKDESDPRKLLFDYLNELITIFLGDIDYSDWPYDIYESMFHRASEKVRTNIRPTFHEQNGSKYDSTATNLLKDLGMTASEVLEAVNAGLDEMIHFKIESDATTSNIPVCVYDWTYDREMWFAPFQPGVPQQPYNEGWQMFRLKIDVPENSDQIHISTYSYVFIWYYQIIMAFQEYFDSLIRSEFTMSNKEQYKHRDDMDQHECENLIGNLEPFDAQVLLDFLENHYLSRTSLILANDRGSGIEMRPFREYTITIKPSMDFHSKTETCEPNSPEHCLDECLARSYEDKCGCIPWQLHSLKREPICNTPCIDDNQPGACTEHCRRQLEHPCALSLYQFETVSRPMKGELRLDRPIFEIHMKKAEVFNHPHFIEEYEMTIGDFTAQLGGLMEFWIGVNVIGILHIFVYVFKQIYRTRMPTTQQAKKSIANFFKRDNKISVTSVPKTSAMEEFSLEYKVLAAQIERRLIEFRDEIKKENSENNAKMAAESRKSMEEMKMEILQVLSSSDDKVVDALSE